MIWALEQSLDGFGQILWVRCSGSGKLGEPARRIVNAEKLLPGDGADGQREFVAQVVAIVDLGDAGGVGGGFEVAEGVVGEGGGVIVGDFIFLVP
jgi:hypothetical protein